MSKQYIIIDREPTAQEIEASLSSDLSQIRQNLAGDEWLISFSENAEIPETLSSYQSYDAEGIVPTLNGPEWTETKTPQEVAMDVAKQAIKEAIFKSKAFGEALITEFGAENVLLGFDNATISQISDELFQLQLALNSGSIYVARAKLVELQTNETWLTQERKDKYLQIIDDYIATLGGSGGG